MELAMMATLFGALFFFLFLGVPVTFSIGLASFLALLVQFPADLVSSVIAQKLMTGLNSFGLLAIPFFILAGNIMNQGGIALRLVEFAKVLGGFLPGSLAHINILANMLFGAISGSAVSSAAAIGGIMSPIQKRENYNPAFSAAVNIASCPSGLLIPPSGVLILFSLVSGGTSVAALFVAGYLPGFIMGASLMIVAAVFALRNGYTSSARPTINESARKLIDALPSLGLIIVVIGGILAGTFTPTEASAIAVIYSLILSACYGTLSRESLTTIANQTLIASGIVLFLVGTSMSMSWVMSVANVPQFVAETLPGISDNPIVLLLLINVILLVVGTFMDLTPAVLIFTPIFLPIVESLGMHPVHFGIMMVFNLCIGICTPPVGSALFIGCGVAGVSVPQVIRPLLPMYIALFIGLLLVTFVPFLSLWLPTWMGLI